MTCLCGHSCSSACTTTQCRRGMLWPGLTRWGSPCLRGATNLLEWRLCQRLPKKPALLSTAGAPAGETATTVAATATAATAATATVRAPVRAPARAPARARASGLGAAAEPAAVDFPFQGITCGCHPRPTPHLRVIPPHQAGPLDAPRIGLGVCGFPTTSER